jgi:CheY-like chemotaxis protein/DNA-binding PadR family transcriptional regulator
MSVQHLILHLLMRQPLSRSELRRKLGPFRAVEILGRVDLEAELEDLEKRECILPRMDPADSPTAVRRYVLTPAGADELAEWMDRSPGLEEPEAPANERLTPDRLMELAFQAGEYEWLRRELSELDAEIGGWRSSLLDRHRASRLALLTDDYRLRSLEHRHAYLGDVLEMTAADRAPRVLVAVDSVAWRAQARNVLASAGYEVRVADDRVRAWELLESAYFDALVLDAGVEVQEGFELLHRVRTTPALSDLPVIWSSVRPDPADRDAALAAGATDHVWMCDPEAGQRLVGCIDRQLR